MQRFIAKPNIDLYPGVIVDKETVLAYNNDHVVQTLKNLELHTVTKVEGENFESIYDTIVHLDEGDVLIFEEDKRGYIKPVEQFVSIDEAISDLTNIKDLG